MRKACSCRDVESDTKVAQLVAKAFEETKQVPSAFPTGWEAVHLISTSKKGSLKPCSP